MQIHFEFTNNILYVADNIITVIICLTSCFDRIFFYKNCQLEH